MKFDFEMIKSRLTLRIEKEFRYKNMGRWENLVSSNLHLSSGIMSNLIEVEVAEHMRTLVEKIDDFIEGLCITEIVNDDNFEYTFCVVESGYILSKRSGAGILHEIDHSQSFYVSRVLMRMYRFKDNVILEDMECMMIESLIDLWNHLEEEQLCLLNPGWVMGVVKEGKVNRTWYLPYKSPSTCSVRMR
jgi:hypothetical protein